MPEPQATRPLSKYNPSDHRPVLVTVRQNALLQWPTPQGRRKFPYVPGFLSFREVPAIKQAIGGLKHEFGAIPFDGQNFAHPRSCGIVSHLAIELDRPGVGVGKSRLTGTFGKLAQNAGVTPPLMDESGQIGVVQRTQKGIRPVFVNLGHQVDLDFAVELVFPCCIRYRIPEPTRQADMEVAKLNRASDIPAASLRRSRIS